MNERKGQESPYPKCVVCKRTIKAGEGRFTCVFCCRSVCEECGKRIGWDKRKRHSPGWPEHARQCYVDGSDGMEWFEGKKEGVKP
jgi:hypothetical protein